MLEIGEGRIYTRISKSQENNVFALIKTGFQCFGSLFMIFLQFFCIMCHWHIDRKKFLVCQFRHCLDCNLVGNRVFDICTWYSNDLILADHAGRFQCH